MMLICILCTCVLTVAALCVNRLRRFRRPAAQGPHEDTGRRDDIDSERLHSSDAPSTPPEFVLSVVPTRIIPTTEANRARALAILAKQEIPEGEDVADCAICLGSFDRHDVVMTLPCDHEFHAICMRRWVATSGMQPTCPLCKAVVSERAQTASAARRAKAKAALATDAGSAAGEESSVELTPAASEC